MHQTISWGCHNGKEPSIKIGGWDGAAEGQQHPEPGLIQPETLEDITFACGKFSEGLGQDLDPLASFQSGWAMSGLCWFFLFGTVWKRACPRKLHFPVAEDPFGIRGAGDGDVQAGQRLLEPSQLHQSTPFRAPGGSVLRSPLAGGKAKPVNGHRPSPFFLGQCPAFSLDLLFLWLWG